MAMVKLSDVINVEAIRAQQFGIQPGAHKLSDLIDQGVLELRKVENFYSPRSPSGYRTAYFADFAGTTSGWEIRKTAYDSRMGLPVIIGRQGEQR